MERLLSVEEAQRAILDRVRPLAPEQVGLGEAAGRFLAEPVRAAVDLPPFPSSAMDGFAVRAADVPARLPIVHRIAAGRPAPRPLGRGEAMAVATGGVVPEGADAVVPIELVVEHDNEVEVDSAVASGANVRARGGDLRAGSPVLDAGMRLAPAQLAAAAAAGAPTVACAGRPRVAVVVTGTELRVPGETLRTGQIYEANGPMLAAAAAAAGADVRLLTRIVDDESAHREAIEQGLAGDVLVTSGGVSVGPHDLVRQVEARLGVEEVFWRVAVRPGKPVSFGVRGATLVFGLPGNPVSSLVGFELFVRPALLALQGATDPLPQFEVGRLMTARRRSAERAELVRARRRVGDDGVLLEPLSGQESHMIAEAARADSLVFIPRGDGEQAAGSAVRYLPLRAC